MEERRVKRLGSVNGEREEIVEEFLRVPPEGKIRCAPGTKCWDSNFGTDGIL